MALVGRLRDTVVPASALAQQAEVNVGGETARSDDVRNQVGGSMWKIILFVLSLSFLVLMVMLRSLILPLKAVLMNLLSIGAAFGVLVAIFQWGWLDGFLGFESQGALDTINVPLIFAIVFGLSMDYEVFLMSRIRERYMVHGDNERAVAEGLSTSARTISSAALIMTSVFAVFVLTGVPSIKELGLGCAVAIALDATLVRLILVPAAMKLMGEWNWWMPDLARPRCCRTSASRAAPRAGARRGLSRARAAHGMGTRRGHALTDSRCRRRGDRLRGGCAAGGDGSGRGGLADGAGASSTSSGSQRLDPELNAFRKVFAEKALLEAEQAEARLKAGEERPLLGVPIAIKDEVDVAGEINTHGTDGFTEPAKADCEMVRRLREAGAIVVGLTLLPEMAICGFTESATYGVTRNPWNPQRSPGGSSGGSGAAVAAGLVPIASAGDGAGSIRIPAASCGLFGLKPHARPGLARARPRRLERARGRRLPQPHGARHRALARRRRRRLAGGRGAAAARAPLRRVGEDPAGQAAGRLVDRGAPRRGAADRLDDAQGAVADAAELLRSLGHEVAERDPDWGGIGNNITARFLRGVAEDRRRSAAPRAARTPHARLRPARRACSRTRCYERRAPRPRGRRAPGVNAIFDAYDVLITPAMGGTALPVRRWEGRGAPRPCSG